MTRTALLLGATGLVGRQLLDELLQSADYSAVTILLRRPLDLQHPKLTQRVIDFGQLDTLDLPAVNAVFCALGTTIKAAGSQDAFYRVDFTYVQTLARRARAAGAEQFLLVSSMGADARSRFFYMRVKGQIEDAIRALDYPCAAVFRPSYLSGKRAQSRPAEDLFGSLVERLSCLIPRKYRAVPGRAVARAMLAHAARRQAGFQIVESDALLAFS